VRTYMAGHPLGSRLPPPSGLQTERRLKNGRSGRISKRMQRDAKAVSDVRGGRKADSLAKPHQSSEWAPLICRSYCVPKRISYSLTGRV